MSTPGLNRLSYIDTLKVLAAFMIVLLHVSAIYVDMTVQPVGKLVYYINALVRPGLFIFLMVSGALLLRPQYTFNFKKNLPILQKFTPFGRRSMSSLINLLLQSAASHYSPFRKWRYIGYAVHIIFGIWLCFWECTSICRF